MDEKEMRDLVTAFQCFNANGFGFKVIGRNPGTITLAQVQLKPDYWGEYQGQEKLLEQVLSDTKCKSVKLDNYLGKNFISIDYLDWNQIPEIIKSVLDKTSYNVCMYTRLNPIFQTKDTFSWEKMEQDPIEKILKYCIEKCETIPQIRTLDEVLQKQMHTLDEFKILALREFATDIIPKHDLDIWISPWNWTTEEGRKFCTLLTRAFPKETPPKKSFLEFSNFNHETCKKYKVLHFGLWNSTLDSVIF